MLKRFNTVLVAIALGATALVAACTQQPDQKSDQTQPAATSEQPATSPQRTTEQPRPAATPTAAPTPVQIAQCVRDGLTADSRTAAQARTLQVGTEVTINGAKQRLADGQSYWSLCSGPTLEQRLAAAEAQLATANQALTQARADLGTMTQNRDYLASWVFVDPNAERSEENTWKHRAEQAEGIDWLKWAFMAWAVIMTVIWYITRRRHSSSNERTGHKTAGLEGIDPRQPQGSDDIVPQN